MQIRRIRIPLSCAILAAAVLLSGCEGSNLYGSARIGVTRSESGSLVLLSFVCPDGSGVSGFRVTDSKDTELWSATPSEAPAPGVVKVDSDPSVTEPGWVTDGALTGDGSTDLQFLARLDNGDVQPAIVKPSDVAVGEISVASWSFGGRSKVSEADFISVNTQWCRQKSS
jgi:hypothetical protein